MMINFRDAKYVISVPSYKMRPINGLKELAVFGKSNVGKSTLINLLTGQKLAFSSKQAGKTKLLNYFLIDKSFYLVDTPGYGFTTYGSKEDLSFGDMMETYFENPQLAACFLLIDSRHEPGKDDLEFLSFLESQSVPFNLIFTKCDQAKQSDIARCKKFVLERKAKNVLFSGKGLKAEELRALFARALKE